MELAEVDRYELDCRYGRAGVDRCYERAGIVLRGYDLKIFFREEGSRVGGTSWWPGTNYRTKLLRKYRKSCAKESNGSI